MTEDTLDYGSGSMAESLMPQRVGGLDDSKHLFIRRGREGVEATFTFAGVENSLRLLFLNDKMVGMKFKKCIIVTNETINRNKIFY